MIRTKRCLFFALLSGVLVSVLLADTLHAADAKIGVLRFTALINGYKRMQIEQKASITKRKELQKEQASRRDELNRLEAKLQQHAPGSEAYNRTEDELQQKKAELETWARREAQKLLLEEGRIIRSIYDDVQKAATEVGRNGGYALILKEDDFDLVGTRVTELKLKVALRKILYVDPSLDITEAVLKLLNKTYAKKQTGGEGR